MEEFRATQFVGSQADAQVLLEGPRAEVAFKALRRRGRRQENEYFIRFPGYPDTDSYWITEQNLRKVANGPQLIAEYEASIEQEEEEGNAHAHSSDEDMISVDMHGHAQEQRPAAPSAVEVAHQIWTQQPSEPQLPQTQPPSQLAGPPPLAHFGPATQEPDPTWEELQRSRTKEIEDAYRREVQASRPALQQQQQRPQQRSGVLNGLPTSMWENSPLVRGRPPERQVVAGAPAQPRAPVQPRGSNLPLWPAQAGPSNAPWGFDDTDEPSQEDLAAADWAAQHAVPQRPANNMPPAHHQRPVGPEQIGFLAADPFRQQSPAAAPARPPWSNLQQSRPAAQPAPAGADAEFTRLVPASFNRNRNSHWLGPSGAAAQAQPVWAPAPAPPPQFAAAHNSPLQPASCFRHAPSPGSPQPPAAPRRQDLDGASPARPTPGHAAPRRPSAGAAEPSRQPLGPLPVGHQQAQAARPMQTERVLRSPPAAPAAAASSPQPPRGSWFDSIAMQLAPGRGPAGLAPAARAAEPLPLPQPVAAPAAPPVPAHAGTAAEAVDGLPPPRQWPALAHPEPPQRLQSPARPAQPAAPFAAPGAQAQAPGAAHQGLFNALGRRAAEMIRQAPPVSEEPAAAKGQPQLEHVRRETWGAWASSLRGLGGTVAAYAAAQVLPPEVAAQRGAPGTPLVDLNALPGPRAQPEEAEEPVEDVTNVPSLPAEQRSRRAQERRRPLKRLKRIYHPEPEEEQPAPELVPDSSEEAAPQDPAVEQDDEDDMVVSPVQPRRLTHVIEDDEDTCEEDTTAAAPGEEEEMAEEDVPLNNEEEPANEDEYGLNAEELWHLQPEHWEDAIINRARHEDEDVLLLRIHWPDGFSSWVNRFALHVRPHCHMKLIEFYESKAKPRQ